MKVASRISMKTWIVNTAAHQDATAGKGAAELKLHVNGRGKVNLFGDRHILVAMRRNGASFEEGAIDTDLLDFGVRGRCQDFKSYNIVRIDLHAVLYRPKSPVNVVRLALCLLPIELHCPLKPGRTRIAPHYLRKPSKFRMECLPNDITLVLPSKHETQVSCFIHTDEYKKSLPGCERLSIENAGPFRLQAS